MNEGDEDDEGGVEPAVTADFYWAPIPERLVYDVRVKHLALRVYAVLIRHGLDPTSCYPKHSRIAGLIGIETRSVQRPIRELEQLGWIKRQPRYNRRGDRISDGYHVYSEPRPPAQESAPPAQESAEGASDGRAGSRDLVRADERGLDRAEPRGQEPEPTNESQSNESPSRREQASTHARSESGGPAGFADRARDAAVEMARRDVDWRVRAGKHIADPAGLAVHIAVNDIWPEHGTALAAIAAGNPDWGPAQIADSMGAHADGSIAGTTAAVYRQAEAARREWESTPVELPDPDTVQRHAAAARAALAANRPPEP